MPLPKPPHHSPSGFRNQDPGCGRPSSWEVLKWSLTRKPPLAPASTFRPGHFPRHAPAPNDVRVTFIGHCTAVLEIAGKCILTDPVFGDYASPIPGPVRRWFPPGIPFSGLPRVDVVLISHNHYDHLEAETIRALGSAPHYIVPLGLGKMIRAWGGTNVTELDWWESASEGPVNFTAVPSQHWSRRTPFDTNRSLWCGYVMQSGPAKALFIGDSGYFEGFREIGQRLGPFHIAMLPIGAYDPRHLMENVHMNPEEAVQACVDLRANILVPTHWGCFPLTDEEPGDPPRRVYREWVLRGLDRDALWLLAPGQSRSLEDMIYIPIARPAQRRLPRPSMEDFLRDPTRTPRELVKEWSVALCPHTGTMVDLETVGHRDSVFEDDAGTSLTLDCIKCSRFGDAPACQTASCPLHDPAFLRAHDLHGTRGSGGVVEQFVEIDYPPEPGWWTEKLRILRKDEDT